MDANDPKVLVKFQDRRGDFINENNPLFWRMDKWSIWNLIRILGHFGSQKIMDLSDSKVLVKYQNRLRDIENLKNLDEIQSKS